MGLLIGFLKKITASSVTFVTAIISIIVSIFSFNAVFKHLEEIFKEYYNDSGIKGEDLKALLYTLYAFIIFVSLEVLIGIIYFFIWLIFLRKVFQKQKQTQTLKKSLLFRLGGSLISLVAIFPFAVFASNASSILVNKEDNFTTKFLKPSIKVLSNNQGETYAGKIKLLNDILTLIKSDNIPKYFADISDKDIENIPPLTEENKEKFENILNNEFVSNALVPIFAKQIGDNKLDEKTLQLDNDIKDTIKQNIKNYNLVLNNLNEVGKQSIKNFLVQSFITDDLKQKYNNQDQDTVKLVDEYANFFITELTNKENINTKNNN
ncbi:hypothetical protein [Mycoplasma miroungirhinis]|uniref:Uncharacterized protein n=1 Tax=Mycoplasma miroungirhinis TaxID=754516 RepID=A0A6M4JBB3_9MOLU|nr:hypothetical protein [Mycoplasma miroungirhinis]QJR44210.1 hypothetical protein HLA92_02065 [Mycoplasma miroungirhinis]